MSWDEIIHAPGARLALAGLALSVVVLGVTAARATRIDAVGDAPPEAVKPPAALRLGGAAVTGIDPSEIAGGAIFAADREPYAERYPMPGDDPVETPPPGPEPPRPEVLGTAVSVDGEGFATVRIGNGQPANVRVGDMVGVWKVTRIGRGAVTFTRTNGEQLDVRAVARPGS